MERNLKISENSNCLGYAVSECKWLSAVNNLVLESSIAQVHGGGEGTSGTCNLYNTLENY